MDFQFLITTLRRRLPVIIATGAVAGLLSFLVGLMLVNYEATGTVMLHPQDVQTEDAMSMPVVGMVYSPQLQILQNQGQSYLGIVKSRSVITQVVDRLELHKRYVGGGASKFVEMLKQPVRLAIYGRLHAYKPDPRQRAIEKTTKAVKPMLIPSSNIMRITAHHEKAETARNIVNTVIDVFVEFGQDRSAEAASNAVVFLTGRLDITRSLRDALKDELQEVKAQAKLAPYRDFTPELSRYQQKLDTAEDALKAHDEQQPILQQRLEITKEILKEVPEYQKISYAVARNPVIEQLKQDLIRLRIEIEALLVDYLPGSAPVSVKTKQIAVIRGAIEDELERIVQTETFQMDQRRLSLFSDQLTIEQELRAAPLVRQGIVDRIGKYRKRLSELEKLDTRAAELDRALSVLEQREADLVLALQKAKSVLNSPTDEVRVLDLAVTPRYPSFNGTPLIAFVMIAALGAAVLAAAIVVSRA